MNIPVNPNSECKPLSPVQLAHREWVGGRVLTLLSQYWRDDDPVELTAAIASDWTEILQGLSQQSIHKACVQYMRDEPRKKPTPGEIYKRANRFDAPRTAKPAENFVPNPDMEQQCILRIESDESYETWPREQLAYMIAARGGHDVNEWIQNRKGWYRPGGPAAQLGGKQVSS